MKCKEFFALQMQVDGFGHDTATIMCFETKQSAENYLEKNKEKFEDEIKEGKIEIVRQRFNQTYYELWD